MSDDWADAVIAFEDAVISACHRANAGGISDKELAKELRRIAENLEDQGA